jgi:hypothetical protein
MKTLGTLVGLLTLVTSIEAATRPSTSKPLVRFENGRLSIKAADVALLDLLEEIQAKSGIVIDLNEPNEAAQRASGEFKNVPLAVALESILRDFNFAFFYSASRLVRVLILRSRHPTSETRSALLEPDGTALRVPRAEQDSVEPREVQTQLQRKTKESDLAAKLEAIDWLEDSEDPNSIAALGDALALNHLKVKEAALRALSAKKDAGVAPMLRRGLRDNDPEFRALVLEALADRGDLDSLRQALADRHRDVRKTAADLLWNATHPK